MLRNKALQSKEKKQLRKKIVRVLIKMTDEFNNRQKYSEMIFIRIGSNVYKSGDAM